MKEDEQEPKVNSTGCALASWHHPSEPEQGDQARGWVQGTAWHTYGTEQGGRLSSDGEEWEVGGRAGRSGHLKPAAALGAMTIPRCMCFRSEMN